MMPGMIMVWAGALVNIPPDWYLCDGSHGTPNLQDKFVVGSGNDYGLAKNGGNSTHKHPYTADPHSHALSSDDNIFQWNYPFLIDSLQTSEEVISYETDYESSLPPYYALAYIMLSPTYGRLRMAAGYKENGGGYLCVRIHFSCPMDTSKKPADGSQEIYRDGNPCGMFGPGSWFDAWTWSIASYCPYGGTLVEYELKNPDANFLSAKGEQVKPLRIDCSPVWI